MTFDEYNRSILKYAEDFGARVEIFLLECRGYATNRMAAANRRSARIVVMAEVLEW